MLNILFYMLLMELISKQYQNFFFNYCIITSCIVVYLKVMKYQETYESTLSMSPRSIYHGVKTGTVQEKLFWTATFYVI